MDDRGVNPAAEIKGPPPRLVRCLPHWPSIERSHEDLLAAFKELWEVLDLNLILPEEVPPKLRYFRIHPEDSKLELYKPKTPREP